MSLLHGLAIGQAWRPYGVKLGCAVNLKAQPSIGRIMLTLLLGFLNLVPKARLEEPLKTGPALTQHLGNWAARAYYEDWSCSGPGFLLEAPFFLPGEVWVRGPIGGLMRRRLENHIEYLLWDLECP